jgi:hypothetical protein
MLLFNIPGLQARSRFSMGKICTIGRLDVRISSRGMAGLGLVAIATAALFSGGCGKGKSSAAQVAEPTSVANANQTTAAMPQAPLYTAAPVEVAASPDGGADLKQLNHAYIGWIVQNRRRPKSFDEYVALSGVQIPPPPAGKKYVIDKNGFINLANN